MLDSYIFKTVEIMNFMCGCHFDIEKNDEKLWKKICTYLLFVLMIAGIIYDIWYDFSVLRISFLAKLVVFVKLGEDILGFICIFKSLKWSYRIREKYSRNLKIIDEIISLDVKQKRKIFERYFLVYVLYILIYFIYDCFDFTLYEPKHRFIVWVWRRNMTDFHVMNYLLNVRIVKSRLIIIKFFLINQYNDMDAVKEFDLHKNAPLVTAFEKIFDNANVLYKQFVLVVSKNNQSLNGFCKNV